MIYIGIDPGMFGAFVAIMPNDIKVFPMPVGGKEIDVKGIINWIEYISPNDPYAGRPKTVAYIEAVHSMPGQGVASVFKFGFGTGLIHGVIRTLNIPLYIVTPQAWKKEILAGTDKSKQAAIDYCLRVFPDVNIFRTERARTWDSGIADALCIAEYGRRKQDVS